MATRRAYLLLAFLTLLHVLDNADRNLLLAFSLPIIRDLRMSYAEFSLLSGGAFVLFNSLALLAAGYLADRLPRPRLMAAGLVLWSGMTAVSGLAGSFGQMAVVRALVGIGEAVLIPASLGLLSDIFPARQRGTVLGIFFMGTPVGVAVSYFLAATLGPSLGWRTCFVALGLVGVALSAVLLLVRDPRPAATPDAAAPPSEPVLRVLGRALGSAGPLRYLLLGATLLMFSIGATVLDQVWLVRDKGFAEGVAQQIAGAFFLVGGMLGTWLGGVGGDWFSRRYVGGRLLFMGVVYALAGPISMVVRVLPPDHLLFYPFVFVGCVNIMLAVSVPIAAATEVAPERIRSTVIAFTILITNVFGYSLGSFLVGSLSDYFRRLGYASPISWADLWITVPVLPAVVCFYLAYRKQQAPARQPALAVQ